jgi:hypothetical protein
VPYSNRPTLYSESTGVASVANPTSTDAAGYVRVYLTDQVFDVIISGSGLVAILYVDEESGIVVPRRTHYNVLDFANVATAIASLPSGARLYFPSSGGPYTPPTAAGWAITNPLTLFGDTAGQDAGGTVGTIIRPFSNLGDTKNSRVFDVQASGVTFENLQISAASQPASIGTGDGIYLDANAVIRSSIKIIRCQISNMGRSGIRMVGTNGGSINLLEILYTVCTNNMDSGAYLVSIPSSTIEGGYYSANKLFGIYIEAASTRLLNIPIEGNQANGTNVAFDTQLRLKLCNGVAVIGCYFEGFSQTTCKTAITIENCYGAVVEGCILTLASAAAGTRGIFITGTSRGCVIGTNAWDRVDTLVQVNAGDNCNGIVVAPQGVRSFDATNGRGIITIPAEGSGTANDSGYNVAFPTLGVTTAAKANKVAGILLPMVNNITEIESAKLQAGLLVYDHSATSLKIYNGTAWETVTSA